MLAIVEELDAPGLSKAMQAYGVKAPETGNNLSAPFAFNRTFKTSITVHQNLSWRHSVFYRKCNMCWPLSRNWMHQGSARPCKPLA